MSDRPVAFLDRDGVLNEFVLDASSGVSDSPLRAEDVRLIPGAAAAAARLACAGFTLVCVTNQPAAARGKVPVARLLDVQRRVEELLNEEGIGLDATRICLHHPEGTVADLAVGCACRKPAPGMLLDTARSMAVDLGASWIVGDTDTDIQAGRAAGCKSVLIEYRDTAHKRTSSARPDRRARDLADGVEQILAYTG